MRNKEVAAIFYMIADLLDIKGEKFKPNAYRRAARVMEIIEEDIEALAAGQKLKEVSGIGEAVAEKTAEYLKTGKVAVLEELRNEIPQGVVDMLEIPGVGPKTAGLVWKELGITDVESLRKAVQEHRLLKLKGFGEKKEAKILRGIEFLAEAKKRTPIGVALPLAEEIVTLIKASAPVIHMDYAGSLRRMRETVGDLDFLVASSKREDVVRAFTSMPFVREVVVAGDTKATVILDAGIQADLRVLDEGSWGSGLQYFTGSKDHNVHLRTIAQRQGLKLSEYGVFRGEEQIAGATEEDVYKSLGMQYIEPEMREDAGEIEAAQEGRLPMLLTMADILGDFHVHTSLSDGGDSLEEMIDAARAMGYAYVGISDHSMSLKVARGVSVDDLMKRRDEIRNINRTSGTFRILLGTECEILANGDLDYPDEVLKELDYVIASVHSKFNMQIEEMTDRVLAAVNHPYVNILAHPFTGMVQRREPIQLDLERVAEEAAERGTALEINAFPDRLDLSGPQARLAREKGAKLVIDTDSHSTEHLAFMRFGVGTARRGWLEPEDVVNCWPYEKVKEFLSR
jgi:DNA polymerase (family 10)